MFYRDIEIGGSGGLMVAMSQHPKFKSSQVEVNKDIEGKTYVAYSPYVNHKDAKIFGLVADRATVAVKKVGDTFVYGISICSSEDQFTKVEGRKRAIERMDANFATINALWYPVEGETWERAIIRFANELAVQAVINPGRYKRKICKNCKSA